MRSTFRSVLVVTVAVCAFSVVGVASASAAPRWEEEFGGVFKEATGGKVIGEGTLTFASGSLEFECHLGQVKGTLETLGKGKIEGFEANTCKNKKGCENIPTFRGIHFPWNAQLEEPVAKETRDRFTSSGAGKPGWEMTCKIITNRSFTCWFEHEKGSAKIYNSGLGYVAEFDGATEEFTCNGGQPWSVRGSIVFKANGVGIEAVRANPGSE